MSTIKKIKETEQRIPKGLKISDMIDDLATRYNEEDDALEEIRRLMAVKREVKYNFTCQSCNKATNIDKEKNICHLN